MTTHPACSFCRRSDSFGGPILLGMRLGILAALLLGSACDRASEQAPPAGGRPTAQDSAARHTPGQRTPNAEVGRQTPSDGGAHQDAGPVQGIRVVTIPGASDSDYSIFDEHGKTRLREREKADRVAQIDPGRYVLKEFNTDFVYARDVVVKPGETTIVQLGAIKLTTVPDALYGDYHLFDVAGKVRLRENNTANQLVTAPPGQYFLTQEYWPFPYAADVPVKPGEVTVVELGALRYHGPHDNHIFEATGAKRLREHGKPGELVTAPPGHFVLKKAYTDEVLAADVIITAGAITEVR